MYQLQLLQREMPSLEAQLALPVKFNFVLCAQAISCPLARCRASHKGQSWSRCCFAGPAELKTGAVVPMAAPKLRLAAVAERGKEADSGWNSFSPFLHLIISSTHIRPNYLAFMLAKWISSLLFPMVVAFIFMAALMVTAYWCFHFSDLKQNTFCY